MIRALLLLLGVGMAIPAQAQQAWTANYPEGPAWIDGTLYWAEMTSDRIMRLDGDQPVEAFRRDGCGPTAIARFREKEFVVLCHLQAAVLVLDHDLKLASVIRTAADGRRLQDPNDASADGNGGVWFTDPGRFSKTADATGAVYHLTRDGELTRHADGLFYGNGIHVDQGAGRLLVSEHLARRVLAYPITEQGLGPAEELFNIDDFDLPAPRYAEAGPDGLEIDANGVLWVAEYGSARLLGWKDGQGLVAAMAVDAPYVTNIAFGPDGQAAMTGAKDNRVFPFPGAVWKFDAAILTSMIVR